MKDRIFKNWITTLLGFVIIITSVVSVFMVEAVNWADASIGIGVGLILFLSNRDDILKRLFKFRKLNE